MRMTAPAIGIASSLAVAIWSRRRRGVDILRQLVILMIAAFVAARIAFLLQHRESYGASLGRMLDITDGGFSAMTGLFVAFVAGSELTKRAAAESTRGPLVIASLTGCTVWVAATIATLDFAPARVAVPLVQLQRLDGSAVQLRTFTDKPMVVNLWATWCPPCRREMPVLRDAQRRHQDITFVFVNQGESAPAIQRYFAAVGLNIDNVFLDPVSAVSRQTDAFAYPTTLFFDSQGMLFMRQIGGITEASLEERLAMLRKTSLKAVPERRQAVTGTSPARDR
jgi:thiol-disulfide isomerase/thioredoxin